jgi:hypothetical protein
MDSFYCGLIRRAMDLFYCEWIGRELNLFCCKHLGFSDGNRESAFGGSKALCWHSFRFFREAEKSSPMLPISSVPPIS